MVLQLFFFTIWHISLIDDRKPGDEHHFWFNFVWYGLVLTVCYFYLIEILQIIRAESKWDDYFSDYANYFDIIPNALILFNCWFVSRLDELSTEEQNHEINYVDFDGEETN